MALSKRVTERVLPARVRKLKHPGQMEFLDEHNRVRLDIHVHTEPAAPAKSEPPVDAIGRALRTLSSCDHDLLHTTALYEAERGLDMVALAKKVNGLVYHDNNRLRKKLRAKD